MTLECTDVLEGEVIPSEDQMIAQVVELMAAREREIGYVMDALGKMAAKADDHEADVISRAMELIEAASYD